MLVGRITVILVFGALLAGNVVLLVNEASSGDFLKVAIPVVRSILILGLFYATYQGKKWARVLTTVLMFIALFVPALVLVDEPEPVRYGLLCYLLFSLYALNRFPAVKRFLRAQSSSSELGKVDSSPQEA